MIAGVFNIWDGLFLEMLRPPIFPNDANKMKFLINSSKIFSETNICHASMM